MDAGAKYGIKPGCPNQIRRIEGGMLSFGADLKPWFGSGLTATHNVLELGLPKRMVTKAADFIGKQALEQLVAEGGPKRLVVGVQLSSKDPLQTDFMQPWSLRNSDGQDVGCVTSLCYSPTIGANIGIATVNIESTTPGTKVHLESPDGLHDAVISKLPFMKRM
jgi:aminomethyltransferase